LVERDPISPQTKSSTSRIVSLRQDKRVDAKRGILTTESPTEPRLGVGKLLLLFILIPLNFCIHHHTHMQTVEM